MALFRLLFPRWDVIAIILSIFLLTYTYIEAKANYHRGSILILRCVDYFAICRFVTKTPSHSYVVLAAGFYYAPPPTTDSVTITAFSGTLTGPTASLLTSIRTYLFAN